MNKEELIEFLKKNLEIKVEDDGKFITVKLLLDNELISEDQEQIYR